MSPELSPAARGAGQKLTREARESRPKTWKCDLCGSTGVEITAKSASRAFDRHYFQRHYEEEK